MTRSPQWNAWIAEARAVKIEEVIRKRGASVSKPHARASWSDRARARAAAARTVLQFQQRNSVSIAASAARRER